MKAIHKKLTDLSSIIDSKIDLFICSVSFEDRCLSIAQHFAKNQVKHALVAENVNHETLHGKNGQKLRDLFQGRYDNIALDTTNPISSADGFISAFGAAARKKPQWIVADVSTFTHEGMLILIRILPMCFAESRISYIYSTAKEYAPGHSASSKWLSKGIGEVRSVLGYPGKMMPSRKLHLMILVGFEDERATELIRRYEPSIISLGYSDGGDPGVANHQASHTQKFKRLRAMFPTANEFSFASYDPEKAQAAILSQINAFSGYNVIVAPMNTKLSTIGAAWAARNNEDVQLAYAQAFIYNHQNYSTPGSHFYLVDDTAPEEPLSKGR